MSVLQLENEQLFETGLALIEQNLHILDSHGVFDQKVSASVYEDSYPRMDNLTACISSAAERVHDGHSRTDRRMVLPQYGR